ncbi:MAG: hypothetical protein GX995_10665, partial [Clostridiales bacterium]|nr:hypothetical protein [Clostridiales bacterium]
MNNNLKEKAKKQLVENGKSYQYYSIATLEDEGYDIKNLPYSIKVLLESVLRQWDGHAITEDHIRNLANWAKNEYEGQEVPFKPARVI